MKKSILALIIVTIAAACSKTDTPKAEKEELVVITTSYGEMVARLYDETPIHKDNFLKLAKEGFYDSTTFHRIISDFMIQGGDPNSKDDNPNNDGQGGPGYTLEAEFNRDLIHKRGALAAARTGGPQNPEKRSSGSQFYVVDGRPTPSPELDQVMGRINQTIEEEAIGTYCRLPENEALLQRIIGYQQARNIDSLQAVIEEIKPIAMAGITPFEYSEEQRQVYSTVGGTPFLDQNYTVFGEVIHGLGVVDSVKVQDKDGRDRPLQDVHMSISVVELSKKEILDKYGVSW
ncbi:MAG: peptidylprolyl isomerase [Bacteroidota bacterium]